MAQLHVLSDKFLTIELIYENALYPGGYNELDLRRKDIEGVWEAIKGQKSKEQAQRRRGN